MPMPFFSIITVAFRAENTIADTIKSALKQDFLDFEIIVKDGLSDDKTLERIPSDSKVKVYSQKDSGIYDAMNQGTELASGEYVIYMNCGDVFASNTVLSEVYAAIKDTKPAMAYGNYVRDGIAHKQPSILSAFYLYRTPLCHQTIFFRRYDLMDTGLYNTGYRVLGDYDAELRLFFVGKKSEYINIVICSYLGGGVSESKTGIEKKREERKEILNKYYSSKVQRKYAMRLALSLPHLRQWLAGSKSPQWVTKLYLRMVNVVNR